MLALLEGVRTRLGEVRSNDDEEAKLTCQRVNLRVHLDRVIEVSDAAFISGDLRLQVGGTNPHI